jgi:4-hydroxy-2-oxoheptanedioate aldolase
MIRNNPLKRRLQNGEALFGTFVRSGDPAVVEVLGFAGFEFIIIDNEHTAMDLESMVNLIRTAELAGIVPTVRIRQKNAAEILRVLDSGAMGVQVPQVDTAEEARRIAGWTKYAPEGERGFAASQRSAGYGSMDPVEYARLSNENILTVCYCETKESVDNLDEILKVPGVDIIFIGPFDLSQAYGVIGQPNHPKVVEVIDGIIGKVRAAGKAAGIIASDAQGTKRWMEKGVQYFAISSDMGLIFSAGRSIIKDLRQAPGIRE